MKIFILAWMSLATLGCGSHGHDEEKAESSADTIPRVGADRMNPVPIGDNSMNSLDWQGTYKGVLPCADCAGIETSLTIRYDSTYTLEQTYQGKPGSQPIRKEGRFFWNAEGNMITLSGISGEPHQYFVGERRIIQLDMQGSRVTGDLADKYVLTQE